MNAKPFKTALATLLLAVGIGAVFAAPASAKPTPGSGPDVGIQSCPQGAVDRDTRAGQFFDDNFVNIRTGPHNPPGLSCTSLGQGQLTHNVQYWCFANGDTVTRGAETWFTWTFLRDTTTGVQGWVSDAYLDFRDGTRGSNRLC